jgi:hypothetical protein
MKFILLLLILSGLSFSQDKSEYYVAAEMGAGLTGFVSTLEMRGLTKYGLSSSVAVYWHPEHLLEAGIETGYHFLYSYNEKNKITAFGLTDASASYYSIPVILLFRMRIFDNFRLQAGSGISWFFNRGEAFNQEFSSRLISIVDFIGISYNYPVDKNFFLGGSFKYTYIFRGEESYVTLQLNAAYKLFTY